GTAFNEKKETKFEIHSIEGLKLFNSHMSDFSYVEGYQPSQADMVVFQQFKSTPDAVKYPYASRWYHHINSFGNGKTKQIELIQAFEISLEPMTV
ncbi:Translation elongation factor 1 beta, partial [Nowakowskiella sp. JEL0078]